MTDFEDNLIAAINQISDALENTLHTLPFSVKLKFGKPGQTKNFQEVKLRAKSEDELMREVYRITIDMEKLDLHQIGDKGITDKVLMDAIS